MPLTTVSPGVMDTQATATWRNRIINGGMGIAQRATSATVVAGTGVPTASTGYPAVDRFFVYSTGANVTAARVAGSGATQFRMQITGAASVTAVGVGQRIEQLNSFDLAGGTATLSVDLANSLLTTVTWTASYANTADTFGTIGTPTKTQIATGTFTVNSTVTNYSTTISIPAAATTGIEILFTVGAQTSGTWTIGNIQLEAGTAATAFERRDYGRELIMCQRYFAKTFPQTTAVAQNTNENGALDCPINPTAGTAGLLWTQWVYPAIMRASPTITTFNPGAANSNWRNSAGTGDLTASTGQQSDRVVQVRAANVPSGQGAYIHLTASAEL